MTSYLTLQVNNKRTFDLICGKCSGLMVKRANLDIKQTGFEPWPGTQCSVLGQDT